MNRNKLLAKISLVGLAASMMVPMAAQAATGQLSPRSATLNKALAGSTNVTATFKFTPSTTNTGSLIKGIKFEMCDSPVETTACSAPDGTATMASAVSSSQSGTDMVNAYGSPTYTGATAVTFTNATGNTFNQADGLETFAVGGITIPNSANKEFYFRITTYNSNTVFNGTTEIDYGGIAVSTSDAINVSGTMPESLVFCVGTTWNTSCSDISNATVNLGTFSPTASNTGTSVMDASTNASSGYVITINGTTMTSGGNTINAMGDQSQNVSTCGTTSCTSTTGSSQFGVNVVKTSGTGTGAAFGGYDSVGTGGKFRFFSGDTVANAAGPTNSNLFTANYVVNVPGSQAAGLYSTTLTYICTATF